MALYAKSVNKHGEALLNVYFLFEEEIYSIKHLPVTKTRKQCNNACYLGSSMDVSVFTLSESHFLNVFFSEIWLETS